MKIECVLILAPEVAAAAELLTGKDALEIGGGRKLKAIPARKGAVGQ